MYRQLYDHIGNIVNLTWEELSSYKTKKNLKITTLRET